MESQIERLRALAADIAERFGEEGRQAVRGAIDAALRRPEPAKAAKAKTSPGPNDRFRYTGIIGSSPAMLEVLGLVDRVASSDIPVLIQGESGTGKELIARAIHENSARAGKAFVTENCAAIPETLQESELFGYKKGAFTGADRERKGLFQMADKGTLFLDEVGDMSPAMQTKLLRALQDGEIRPVGGTKSLRVNVRVVSASNRLLREMVDQGSFREDLFYRLNGVTLELPPLRERSADIPALAEHFLKKVSEEMRRATPAMDDEVKDALKRYRWPGNIRELENEMRRCLALIGNADRIGVELLSDELRAAVAR